MIKNMIIEDKNKCYSSAGLSSGLSWGILDVPILGGVVRVVDSIPGVDTNFNDSPEWRKYGTTIITAAGVILGTTVTILSGGIAAPAFVAAMTSITGIVAKNDTLSYYNTHPNVYWSDKITWAKYNFDTSSTSSTSSTISSETADEILKANLQRELLIGGAVLTALVIGIMTYKNNKKEGTLK